MIEQPIFLCGMMGAGKSTVGPLLARLTSKLFADLDQMIVETEQMEIPAIFATKGEAYFRECEREQLLRCTQEFRGVLALGGGSLQNQSLTDIVKKSGWLVYLQPDLEQLTRRLAESSNRPMLSGADHGGIRARVSTLLKERGPFYEQAHFTIKTGTLSPDEIAQKIFKKMQTYEA